MRKRSSWRSFRPGRLAMIAAPVGSVALIIAGCSSTDSAPAGAPSETAVAPSVAEAVSSPSAAPEPAYTFTAGGDIGATDETDATLAAIRDTNPGFHLALGDLGYSDVPTEAEWCAYVRSHLDDIPFQLLVGNHEDDDRLDGHIDAFAACLPDGMDATGDYPIEYYFDVGTQMRVIMIAADNDVGGEKVDYEPGTPNYEWLQQRIREARQQDISWVIVGMHKVCISAGNKDCEVGQPVIDLLIDERVDLVLHGHDHDYQRSKQVTCVAVERYDESCVADDDDQLTKGAGTVWIVNGLMGGGGITDIEPDDPEMGYLAASMGRDDPGEGRGFTRVDVTDDEMRVRFIGSTATYADEFRITR